MTPLRLFEYCLAAGIGLFFVGLCVIGVVALAVWLFGPSDLTRYIERG